MHNNKYIDELLQSDENSFTELLEKIENKTLLEAKEELALELEINNILFEAIEFTIEELYEEEGIVSRVLYHSFGVGREKNQKRGQLLFLGNQILKDIITFERHKSMIKFHQKNVLILLKNLKELSTTIAKRSHFLDNPDIEEKSQNYLKVIYLKIDDANQVLQELNVKYIYLKSCIHKSHTLLEKIPRNKELQNGQFLLSS